MINVAHGALLAGFTRDYENGFGVAWTAMVFSLNMPLNYIHENWRFDSRRLTSNKSLAHVFLSRQSPSIDTSIYINLLRDPVFRGDDTDDTEETDKWLNRSLQVPHLLWVFLHIEWVFWGRTRYESACNRKELLNFAPESRKRTLRNRVLSRSEPKRKKDNTKKNK